MSKLTFANIELDEVQSDVENTRAENNELKIIQDELKAERKKLENEIAPIRELRKLKTKISKIKIPDKPLFGNAKLPYEDLAKLKEMADAYIANEDEIKSLRNRSADVSKRENAATEKEEKLNAHEKSLAGKKEALALSAQYKSERDNLSIKVNTHARQIQILTEKNNLLAIKANRAFDLIAHIVKAVRILKYGTSENGFSEYGIANLTPAQGTLIDSLACFGAKLADNYGYNKHSEKMRKYIGMDEGITAEMKTLNPEIFPKEKPQQKSQSRSSDAR
jgi:hypothetical protein